MRKINTKTVEFLTSSTFSDFSDPANSDPALDQSTNLTSVLVQASSTTTQQLTQTTSTNLARSAPTPAEFRVPVNKIEHNQMVERLVSGGSLASEAEQVIAGRKTAFKKALREHKRDNTPKTINTRRNSKNSKPVANQASQNGY